MLYCTNCNWIGDEYDLVKETDEEGNDYLACPNCGWGEFDDDSELCE